MRIFRNSLTSFFCVFFLIKFASAALENSSDDSNQRPSKRLKVEKEPVADGRTLTREAFEHLEKSSSLSSEITATLFEMVDRSWLSKGISCWEVYHLILNQTEKAIDRQTAIDRCLRKQAELWMKSDQNFTMEEWSCCSAILNHAEPDAYDGVINAFLTRTAQIGKIRSLHIDFYGGLYRRTHHEKAAEAVLLYYERRNAAETPYKIHAEDIQLVFEIIQCSQGSLRKRAYQLAEETFKHGAINHGNRLLLYQGLIGMASTDEALDRNTNDFSRSYLELIKGRYIFKSYDKQVLRTVIDYYRKLIEEYEANEDHEVLEYIIEETKGVLERLVKLENFIKDWKLTYFINRNLNDIQFLIDAVNNSVYESGEFNMQTYGLIVDAINNPLLSLKAKGLLALFLNFISGSFNFAGPSISYYDHQPSAAAPAA